MSLESQYAIKPIY